MSKAQSSSKTAPKNVSVYLRVRPANAREKEGGHTFDNIKYKDSDDRVVSIARNSGSKVVAKDYYFNKVFRPDSKQKDVYETYARNAVNAALDGEHGVLFVYGQTGSGKTFTISNEDPKNLGVLQQAVAEIWDTIAKDTKYTYRCTLSYVQLYNEILTDLLDANKGHVRIQLGTEDRGDVVLVSEATGLPVERPVTDYKSTMDLFHFGMKQKEMAGTTMNATSSRSHTVFTLNINKSTRTTVVTVNDGADKDDAPSVALEGRLVLCDLAGSERVSKTHAEGKTLVEAAHINKSLLVLGKVVAALTEKKVQFPPFRESKLTRILQYSLQGNGNTSIVVNISPSDDNTEESLSAVYFGQRALQIKQDAKRHEVLDYKALYLQLQAEMDAKVDHAMEDTLAEERAAYEDRINNLEQTVKSLTTENELLKEENKSLKSGLPPEKLAAFTAAAGASGNNWQKANEELRQILAARDERMKVVNDERMKLAVLLSQEKVTCFNLAKKLQAIAQHYRLDRAELMRRQNTMAAELASLKGTDYISAFSDTEGASPVLPSARGPLPAGSTADALATLTGDAAEEVSKLQAQLQAYREDRIELGVYQNKAAKAIRLLVAEKEELEKKLKKLQGK